MVSPILIALLTWLGGFWSVPFASMHPTVSLAEQVRLEELGLADATTDASDAFRGSGQPAAGLYEEARSLQQKFKTLGHLLGGWIGVVLCAKLIQLSIRRRRTDYHPDQSGCVSCGRCFRYCPVEQVRLGLIDDVSEVVQEPVQ
jgi:NosR/NirI family nitrous oxide reductase transcriptional regulator